ncbi:hypothetical protein P4O66_003834 [Electrophorus voltai]|uniref:Uncharacterized protein n=1 Tax=Electrophorus voltai TaxID=2609070 RepID=A0AAD8ZRP7_9TELE|nr:hypothetical protein P4O66_003834 [Electrophorus voltai]
MARVTLSVPAKTENKALTGVNEETGGMVEDEIAKKKVIDEENEERLLLLRLFFFTLTLLLVILRFFYGYSTTSRRTSSDLIPDHSSNDHQHQCVEAPTGFVVIHVFTKACFRGSTLTVIHSFFLTVLSKNQKNMCCGYQIQSNLSSHLCFLTALSVNEIVSSMDLSQAVEWSRQENINPANSIVLGKVLIDVADDIIESVLGTVKMFGRRRIQGCPGDSTSRRVFILLESSMVLEHHEVGIEGEVGPWPLHLVSGLVGDSSSGDDVFRAKLSMLLQQEGKPMQDVLAMARANQPPKANLSLEACPNPNMTNTLSPDAFDFGDSAMPEEAKQHLCEKMMERGEVFSHHEWDVGCSKSTLHEIRLMDSKLFRERSHHLAPGGIEDVHKHLRELQENGIISGSRSLYASPIVVVRKKSGKVRMCVVYRTLNQQTIPDQYTIPRIGDALHSLLGRSRLHLMLHMDHKHPDSYVAEGDHEELYKEMDHHYRYCITQANCLSKGAQEDVGIIL